MANTPAWQVGGVVGFYMAVALIMVMVNKSVMTHTDLPLTFLFFQLGISVILLNTLSLLPLQGGLSRFHFTIPRWTPSTILRLAPLCAVNIIGLTFNIYCLKLVDASYFQVARGLTLPLTVVLQAGMDGVVPTKWTVVSCAVVSYGFAYSFIPSISTILEMGSSASRGGGVMVQPQAPVLGMILGFLSAAMVAVHAVLIRSSLKHVSGSTLDLAYWQNAVGALALLPGMALTGELFRLWNLMSGNGSGDLGGFVRGSAVTGVTGFLICIAGLLSIKVTSPVTHMFSSAVRSVLQTALGVYIFGDLLNMSRLISISLILAGSTLYTYAKAYLTPTPPPSSLSTEKSKA